MLILLSHILILTFALKKHQPPQNLTNIHFDSSTETSHQFQLLNLSIDKHLIIIPKTSPETYLHSKSLSPTISLQANNITCTLSTSLSYCIIPSINSTRLTVDSKCLTSPCSISL